MVRTGAAGRGRRVVRTRPTTAALLRVPPACGIPGRRPADPSPVLRAGRAGRSGRRRRRSRDGIRGRACDDWTCSQCAPGGRRLCVRAAGPVGRVGKAAELKGGRSHVRGIRDVSRPRIPPPQSEPCGRHRPTGPRRARPEDPASRGAERGRGTGVRTTAGRRPTEPAGTPGPAGDGPAGLHGPDHGHPARHHGRRDRLLLRGRPDAALRLGPLPLYALSAG